MEYLLASYQNICTDRKEEKQKYNNNKICVCVFLMQLRRVKSKAFSNLFI